MSGWIMAALAVAVAISNLIAFTNRQQLVATKMEMAAQMASMELRLSEKISGAYVSWQAHNDLEKRVDRIERSRWNSGTD